MGRPNVGILLVSFVLGGCGGGVSTRSINDPGLEAPPGVPAELVLHDPVHYLGGLAREPMVVEHPNGALFVTGYGSQVHGVDPDAPPSLWRSTDGGSSWRSVDVGTSADGARGNSDVDLAVGPDGTLYFMVMGFDRTNKEGTHIAMGVSHDVGASWRWTSLSEDRFDDRPWVRIALDGTAHAIWNDGSGVSHAVSADGGRSWEERSRVHAVGGSSHLAVGPEGEVAVRITPMSASANRFDEGVELIAVSTDGGHHWMKHPAPGTRDWDPTWSDPTKVPRWVEPLAWDSEGTLYHLWSEGEDLVLARSVDRGAAWTQWTVVDDEAMAFFPYLVARGPGELAATWFTGSGDGLTANVALIQASVTGDDPPSVVRVEPFRPDSWRDSDQERTREPAGEYLPVIFLSNGDLGVVSPVQDSAGDRYGFTWWAVDVR